MAADPVYPRRRDLRVTDRDEGGRSGWRPGRGPDGGSADSPGGAAGDGAGSTPGGGSVLAPDRPAADQPVTAARRPARGGSHDPLGRHANGVGDGFGRLVAGTLLGTVVPGAGLVLAGRRALGWTVITLVALGVGAVVALVVTGRAVPLALRVGTDPTLLLAAAVAVVVLALAWCLLIIGSHLALRRNPLTTGQRVLAVVLVAALMGIVSLPTATAARYAVTQRSVLASVFDDDGRDREGLADPDVAAADPWATTPRVNVLLLGADTGEDRTGTRPDTIIVASIDTRSGESVLFSLPRQMEGMPFNAGSQASRAWPQACEENGNGGCWLNAVWLFGEQHPEFYPGASNPGAAATREAAGSALGLAIDYEAVVDLQGFEELVDAMGGIVIDVPRDIPIGGIDAPITGYVTAGQDRRLNGYDALWFARSRTYVSNDDRMARQQCLIDAAVDQFDVAQLARAFPALAASAERNVETDISARKLPAFIELGMRVKGAPRRVLSLTSANIDTGDPDYAAIRVLVQQALVPPAPTPAPSASSSASPSASAGTPAPTADPGEAVDTSQACGAGLTTPAGGTDEP